MLARLGCLFVIVPLVELALLIWVGQWMGVLPTVLLVAGTGVVGAWLARSQGIEAMTRLQLELSRGGLPGKALMDGAAILVGGTLLLTPGVLTDLLGFALLIPPTRAVLQGWARRRLERNLRSGKIQVIRMGPRPAPPDDDEDDSRPPPRPGEIVQ